MLIVLNFLPECGERIGRERGVETVWTRP